MRAHLLVRLLLASALPLLIACSSAKPTVTLLTSDSTGGDGGGGGAPANVCPAPPAVGTCDLTMGLTGWWRGENDGTDSVGTANAVWMGAVNYEPGKICQGFDFNGASSFVRAPFVQTGPLTIDFWAESAPQVEDTFDAAFSSGDVAAPPYFQIDSDGSGNYRFFAETDIPIGPIPMVMFEHLAITYDGSTVTVYVNGSAVGNADWTKNQPLQFATLKIGSNRATNRFFKGVIDELHIWNRALSPAEVASLVAINGQTLCP